MPILTWEEFKKQEKIWVGDYMDTPEDSEFNLDSDDEKFKREEFEEYIKKLQNLNADNYKISPLSNEDGEYCGCFLEEIIINGIKIGASIRGQAEERMQDGEFEGSWAELYFKKEGEVKDGKNNNNPQTT